MKSIKNSVSDSNLVFSKEIEVNIHDFFINGILSYIPLNLQNKKCLVYCVKILKRDGPRESYAIKIHEFYSEDPIKESSFLNQEFSPKYFSCLCGEIKI
ncbi:hypothetical protein COT60_00490 [Candidatus Pacearchaeota archaeon CG09_land_8_20_14_0_10_30_9]|nr:hypothetical protein [Candidatus Pacearchaeota archaeon]OIO41363.1 MAG: hypothetical protein AUJ61_00085 [Candidatus Pacearchaeota archaeon CG1_02_30_18]PIN71035.1 MAG: hypothetical protein COV77_04130 [Candidatus Pacearchaeota archaeon CG11_big_fil_rev_8_21_14_0_20_30_13]PIO01433.1 MAG: hypothetical protein COT60_00490 [Candidatus Pacearchaeota archaeon CG09_land_8_20_14_0_10_30_9]PIZ82035.1 MAG: hypothetical protein COX98_01340 [Candidatus Pacearchaeota archaeon CG_4_10_14_0_2_um_filter_30